MSSSEEVPGVDVDAIDQEVHALVDKRTAARGVTATVTQSLNRPCNQRIKEVHTQQVLRRNPTGGLYWTYTPSTAVAAYFQRKFDKERLRECQRDKERRNRSAPKTRADRQRQRSADK
eukprot:m.10376 g.10376  ORF g.10376 m.10376 type:complete len:118 (+) comp7357_c0_seq2:260-613(+)